MPILLTSLKRNQPTDQPNQTNQTKDMTTITNKKQTLAKSFSEGRKSGKFPNSQNTEKAIVAIMQKNTLPNIKAYWSGYLCQLTQDNKSALYQ